MATLSSIVLPNNVTTATNTQVMTNKTIAYDSNTLTGVQPTLVSGTTIKTIGGNSLLSSGDVSLAGQLLYINSNYGGF